jgi:hypothetical protein
VIVTLLTKMRARPCEAHVHGKSTRGTACPVSRADKQPIKLQRGLAIKDSRPKQGKTPTKSPFRQSGPKCHRQFWVKVLFVLKRQPDIMKSYCLSDISPSRTHNRSDRSPGYRLCYVTEQYVPRIGYLKREDLTKRYNLITAEQKCVGKTVKTEYRSL